MTHISYATRGKKKSLRHIHGECLERVGLHMPHGGMAVICSGETAIKVGDLVHCARIAGAIPGQIKQVQKIEGDTITVGTAYEDPSRDFSFEAEEIYGVLLEVYCKASGKLIWKRENT